MNWRTTFIGTRHQTPILGRDLQCRHTIRGHLFRRESLGLESCDGQYRAACAALCPALSIHDDPDTRQLMAEVEVARASRGLEAHDDLLPARFAGLELRRPSRKPEAEPCALIGDGRGRQEVSVCCISCT
jgi:hypothetical protein